MPRIFGDISGDQHLPADQTKVITEEDIRWHSNADSIWYMVNHLKIMSIAYEIFITNSRISKWIRLLENKNCNFKRLCEPSEMSLSKEIFHLDNLWLSSPIEHEKEQIKK